MFTNPASAVHRLLCAAVVAVAMPTAVAAAASYPGYPYPGYPYPGYPCAQYPSYPGCTPPGGGGDTGGGGGGGGSTDTGTPDAPAPAPDATGPAPGTPPITGGPGAPLPPLPPLPPKISGPSSLGTLTPKADGTFGLPGVLATCPSGVSGSCSVDVNATANAASGAQSSKRVVVAGTHFRLKPGRKSSIRLKLTKSGKKLLARKRLLKLTAVVVVRTPAGLRKTKTVKLKIRKRHR